MNLNPFFSVIFLTQILTVSRSQNSSIFSDFLDFDSSDEDYYDYSTEQLEFEPIIKLPQGYVSGVHLQSSRGKNYTGFYGIQYAKAKRFENPTKAPSWTGIRSGHFLGPICLQFDTRELEIVGTEDCLNANVFTPNLPLAEQVGQPSGRLLPVLIQIHGGLFSYESSAEYSPDYLLNENVILVTFNHRVGPLGYLSTGDSNIPGNFGLKDQVALLQWVKENIIYFGGDPNKVTIFGQDSGGVSVSLHILSPLSAGNALCNWAIKKGWEAIDNAQQLAKYLECPMDNSLNFLNCLKKKNGDEIVTFMPLFYDWLLMDPLAPFSPTIEPRNVRGAFLTEDPDKIWTYGKINSVPLIIGMNQNEGKTIHSDTVLSNDFFTNQLNNSWNIFAPITFNYEPSQRNSKMIRNYYFGQKDINNYNNKSLENLYSDRNFGSCTREAAILHSKRNSTFLYLFKYGGELDDGKYAGHGDDLIYLFNNENYFSSEIKENSDSDKMSRKMTSIFSSFAYYGRPLSEPNWKEISPWAESQYPRWYELDLANSKFDQNPSGLQQRLDFWSNFKNFERNTIPQGFSENEIENNFIFDVPLMIFEALTDEGFEETETESKVVKRQVPAESPAESENAGENGELIPQSRGLGRVKRQTTIIRFIFRRVYGFLRVVLQTLGFIIENVLRTVGRIGNGVGNLVGNTAGQISRRFRFLAAGYRNRLRGRRQQQTRNLLPFRLPRLRFPRLRRPRLGALGGGRSGGQSRGLGGLLGRIRGILQGIFNRIFNRNQGANAQSNGGILGRIQNLIQQIRRLLPGRGGRRGGGNQRQNRILQTIRRMGRERLRNLRKRLRERRHNRRVRRQHRNRPIISDIIAG